jgi:hypothetical protein
MNAPPPERRNGLGRTRIMLLTMVAEVVGVVLIVAVPPLSWSVRLVLIAVYVVAMNAASRFYLRRQGF